MKYEKIKEELSVHPEAFVDVKQMGSVTEITYNKNKNLKAQTIKLSKDEYLVTSTGEIKEYEKQIKTSRMQSPDSVRRTMRRIKELVQTNVTDVRKVRWCTLTYAENMTDTERLYQDFRKFNQRFQRYLMREFGQKAEYISVAEPQARNAWHWHCIYIFPNDAPYIPNDVFAEIWGHGFTKIKALDNTENIAVYLLAYLSDMEISTEYKELFDEKEYKEVEVNGERKAFIKGQRLKMYPANFNIVRHSKGIHYPVTQKMPLWQAEELVADKQLKYHNSYRLYNDEGYETFIDRKEYR